MDVDVVVPTNEELLSLQKLNADLQHQVVDLKNENNTLKEFEEKLKRKIAVRSFENSGESY